jgi:uncharacterized protein GlcG (DUF336 family)
MTELTLALADTIADAALAKGAELGTLPLTVAVLDAGGHVKVMKRADGSGILRCEIAYGKAWGALGMGLPSRALAARAAKMPAFFTAIAAASEGRIIPVPGGVLVRDAEGRLLGAVGISGDTSDVDEVCAVAGIEAAGLKPDTEER